MIYAAILFLIVSTYLAYRIGYKKGLFLSKEIIDDLRSTMQIAQDELGEMPRDKVFDLGYRTIQYRPIVNDRNLLTTHDNEPISINKLFVHNTNEDLIIGGLRQENDILELDVFPICIRNNESNSDAIIDLGTYLVELGNEYSKT